MCINLRCDLQEVPHPDEGSEGTYLPQAAEVEVPNLREDQDAAAALNPLRR